MNWDNRQGAYTFLDKYTFECVCRLSERSERSIGEICYVLCNTALKYNYRNDGRYICCENINRYEPLVYNGRQKMRKVEISFSVEKFNKIEKLRKIYSESRSAFIRSLIKTALVTSYDENLTFHKPIPIKAVNDQSYSKKIENTDIILLDIC